MWNQFLNQYRSQRQFQNTPILIMGSKHCGKRSLVDSLFGISKTTVYEKKLSTNIDANKMRVNGLTTVIDYAYLNVLDLNDIDYKTHTKLQIYIVEQYSKPQLYLELARKELLNKAIFIIMLDFSKPWNFIDDIQHWVSFINQMQQQAGITIVQMQQMTKKVQNIYKQFKEPQLDQFGKLKNKFQMDKIEEEAQLILPIPEGALTHNLRIPLIICINKSDLQNSVLRDDSSKRIMFVLYHLRKLCLKYGGSLIYTSIKNNTNLDIFYEYLLHTAYQMPFKYKTQVIHQQGIFIPLGADNPTRITDSVLKMDPNKPYDSIIINPSEAKVAAKQIPVKDEFKFFEKYLTVPTEETMTTKTPSLSNDKGIDVRTYLNNLLKDAKKDGQNNKKMTQS